MIDLLFSNPLIFFIIFPGLLMSIAIHEYAHCLAADKLGDPTARVKGRLTLNPLVHLDPVGTIAILLTRFGWGKPAPYDPYNLKEPIRDTALIALSGPVANLSLALGMSMLLRLNLIPWFWLAAAMMYLIYINVMLAIFNLIPVHPLDGGKILLPLLPKQMALEYESIMERFGLIILIILINPFGPVTPAAYLISPIIELMLKVMLGSYY